MQRVFLSYTYHPHPDLVAETDALQRTVRRVIEAMGLRVVDGIDVGGRALDPEIDKRIKASDAMIALVTPQADGANNKILPEFVKDEFTSARTLNKARIRILHHELANRGLGTGEEYIPFEPAKSVDVVVKLMQTIALWKSELGRPVRIQIQPEDPAVRFNPRQRDSCEYELLLDNGETLSAQATTIWAEPGAAYVFVPNFVEGAKVRVKLRVGTEDWESRFVLPQMGGVALTKT